MEKVFGLNYEREVFVGEHKILLPKAPKKKEDILFYNEKPENAYWDRKKVIADYPDMWYNFIPYKTQIDCDSTLWNADRSALAQLSKEDTKTIIKLYNREFDRRENGVHFRNGNDLEYITGSNWFTLVWCRMFGNPKNGGYGLYAKFQRDVFYLLDHMWKPNILGLYLSKAKKTGITQLIDGGYFVDMSTRKQEWMIGMMSVKIDKANENNMKLFLYAFDSLPLALKPNVGFRATKGGNLEFSESTKIKSGKPSEIVLNTRVFTVPTSEHSFDSHFMNLQHSDEFPKYFADSNEHPKEIFRNNKAGVKFQNIFRGRYILSSYPPEKDDEGSKEAERIYMDSKLSTCDEHGKTTSELICYHIPAHKSLFDCIDEFGDCDEVKALNIIITNRERVKKDKNAYLAEVRQNPIDEKEAFGSSAATSPYDVVYISELESDLKQKIEESPIPIYNEGKLVWTNPMWEVGKKDLRPPRVFGAVNFVPVTKQEIQEGKKGRLNIYKEIPPSERNLPLMLGHDDLGNLIAPARFKYVGGIDPTGHADVGDVEEPSMLSSFTMNLHDQTMNNHNREIVSNIILSEYNYRPDLAEEMFQDMVKEIIYFGKLVIVEANASTMYTRLKNEGLANYLMVKHKDGYICKWNMGLEDNEYKGITRTKNAMQDTTMEAIIELTKHYLYHGPDASFEYARTIKSLKLLHQLKNFDPQETRKSDAAMSFGYALMCYNAYIAEINKPQDSNLDDFVIRGLFSALQS